MATWIEPLELGTWIMNVFAGNPDIFMALALMFIAAGAAFFRMNTIGLFFMIILFVLMFSGFISSTLTVLIGIIGGLLVGYALSKAFQ